MVTRCGCFYALGMWTPSGESVWPPWIATAAILSRRSLHWGGWLMHLGLRWRSCRSSVARLCFWRPFANTWAVGIGKKLIDYPVFDLRLFRRCLQRTSSSVFGSLDGLAMTEFIVNRLKGAETRDWMSSRPALRRAILTNDLSMPHLVDVVANIVGVWPLIVSYLKETGRKDDGDSLVVRSSFFLCVGALFVPVFIVLRCVSEEGN